MTPIFFLTSAVGAALLLVACGGSNTTPNGVLLETPTVLATVTKTQLNASGLINLSGPAKCDVQVIPLNYVAPGAKGEASNASGVLLLPTGTGCTAAAPLVAYAKGTDAEKTRTLANPTDSETGLLAAM